MGKKNNIIHKKEDLKDNPQKTVTIALKKLTQNIC